MALGADDDQARRDARWERYQAESRARMRRTLARFQLVMAPLWVLFAALRWRDDDADPLTRWIFTALAAAYAVTAVVLWWTVLRRPLPGRERREPRIE